MVIFLPEILGARGLWTVSEDRRTKEGFTFSCVHWTWVLTIYNTFPDSSVFWWSRNSSLWLMKESIKQVHCLAFKWDLTELEQGAVGLLTAGSTSMLGLQLKTPWNCSCCRPLSKKGACAAWAESNGSKSQEYLPVMGILFDVCMKENWGLKYVLHRRCVIVGQKLLSFAPCTKYRSKMIIHQYFFWTAMIKTGGDGGSIWSKLQSDWRRYK